MAGDLISSALLGAIALGVWGLLVHAAGRDVANAVALPLRVKQVRRTLGRVWRWARGP